MEDIQRIKEKLRDDLLVRKDVLQSSTKKQIHSVEIDSKIDNDVVEELAKNSDLTSVIDPNLQFGKKHLGLALYFFNRKITQNYLQALKYYILTESVQKQTWFNNDLLKITKSIFEKIEKTELDIKNLDSTFRQFLIDAQIDLQKKIGDVDQSLQKKIDGLELKTEESLQKKIDVVELKTEESLQKSSEEVASLDKTFRQFLIDAQIDLQKKIDDVETKVKINFDRQMLFNELSGIKEGFSWLKIADMAKISYYNDNPKTERFIEYLWILKNLISKGKILDVGCVESIFPQEISKNKSIEVYGIDSRQYENPEFNFSIADVRKMSFEDNFFDQVTIISTLEHIGLLWYDNEELDEDGDIKAMKEIKRVLKNDGTVLITIPYGGGQTNWYRSYDKKRLTEIFNGFKINKMKYFFNKDLAWIETNEEGMSKVDNSEIVNGIVVVKATIS